MKNLFLLFAVLLFCSAARSQTLSPVIGECGKHCRGQFTVTNNGLSPMAVTVQPYSFSLDAATGKSIFRPLDSSVAVRLGESSARVPIKGTHTFSYDLQCASAPCSVTFIANMITGRTAEGLQIHILLPHVVYVCDKPKGCRESVRKAAGL